MEGLQNDLLGLMSHRAPQSVSLYLSCSDATHTPDAFVKHWKNAMKTAREQLGNGYARGNANGLPVLTPEVRAMARKNKGLAVFFSKKRDPFLYPLSFEVADQVAVSQRFHLKPILAALSWPQSCFVLCLSQHSVRLLSVDDHGHQDVPLDPTMPHSLEAVRHTLNEPHLDLHTARQGEAVFHGQDRDARRREEDLRRFLSAVAQAVKEAIVAQSGRASHKQGAPLILAGVHEITTAFRKQSDLWILDEEIHASAGHESTFELAQAAAQHAKAASEKAAKEVRDRIDELGHTSRIKTGVMDIVRASNDGRVEALVLQDGASVWGTFDPEQRSAQLRDEPDGTCEDLLDRAAVDTFRQGGSVQIVSELPASDEPAVALLRY